MTTSDGGVVTLDVAGLGAIRATTATATAAPAVGARGTIALRPEKVRIGVTANAGRDDNRVSGTVADLLYMGDVTVYKVSTPGGLRVEALLANSQSGRAKFFEVDDAVEMSWPIDAGHYIEG